MKGLMMFDPLTTQSILDYGVRVFPQKKIITRFGDSRSECTFRDLGYRSQRLAHAIRGKLEIKSGERVATLARNHQIHVELYYAIPAAGAVCHTLNIRLAPKQLKYIINHADDQVLFVDWEFVPLLESMVEELSIKKYVVLYAPLEFESTLPNVVGFESLFAAPSREIVLPPLDENDACAMCYTSGTTGHPKGVVYSHRSTYLHAMTVMSPNGGNIGSADRVLVIVPQFHAMAWGYPFVCLLAGADMVLPATSLSADGLVQIMKEEGVTHANGVPTIWLNIYDVLKNDPPGPDFPLREFIVGGSAVPKDLLKKFEDDFGIRGIHSWGMTETSPVGTMSRLQYQQRNLTADKKWQMRSKPGIELPGISIRIVGANGEVLNRKASNIGEIQVKGSNIVAQYYHLKDNDLFFTSDGWFRTGDVGSLDEEGYLTITDRTKDVIKSGGEWISSVALETALMAHPSVKEAAVIAIPDKIWIERPLAVIVPRIGSINIDELREFLERDFAKYQIPDRFEEITEIPKTSVGKFDKKKLRQIFMTPLR